MAAACGRPLAGRRSAPPPDPSHRHPQRRGFL